MNGTVNTLTRNVPPPRSHCPRSLQPSDSQILVSYAPQPPGCLLSSDVLATSRPTESESPGWRDPRLPLLLHGPGELRKYHPTVSRRPWDRPAHAVGPPETCDEVSSLFRPVILYLGYTLKSPGQLHQYPLGGTQTSGLFLSSQGNSNVQPKLITVARSSGSQSGVPGPAALALPGNLLEMQIVRPALDLPNQTLWREGGQTN